MPEKTIQKVERLLIELLSENKEMKEELKEMKNEIKKLPKV